MLTISIINLYMEYGDKKLFKIKSQKLSTGDKIGIIGSSGCGKTTLLNIIAGYLRPVSGSVTLYSHYSYIKQLDNSVGDIADQQQRYRWGVPQQPKSGGEIMRQKIAQALSGSNDILLCDEPTSNLDEQGIVRLENTLKAYKGTLLLISHDRQLIDRVCNKIWDLDDGFEAFGGNYTSYCEQRDKKRKNQQKEFEKFRKKRRSLTKAIQDRSQKASKMTSAPKRMGTSEARLHKGEIRQKAGTVSGDAALIKKRLESLEVKKPPSELPSFKLQAMSGDIKSSKTAVRVESLSYAYGDKEVLTDISFDVKKGEKVAIVGSNGSGKTTLLSCIINGVDGAKISPGNTTGYFAQDLNLPERSTILEYVMADSELPQHMARTVLARLGIKREQVHKKIEVLSGGERCKITLAALICRRCSLLILDEPTNYLDIYVLEALEAMLRDYDGTLILVTHDRYFRQRVANRIISLD